MVACNVLHSYNGHQEAASAQSTTPRPACEYRAIRQPNQRHMLSWTKLCHAYSSAESDPNHVPCYHCMNQARERYRTAQKEIANWTQLLVTLLTKTHNKHDATL